MDAPNRPLAPPDDYRPPNEDTVGGITLPPEITALPENSKQWRARVRELIQELRRKDLTPCRGALYRRNANGTMSACVEGVINDMAIRGGINAQWIEYETEDDAGNAITTWDAMCIASEQHRAIEPVNRALGHALLYHGMDLPGGQLIIDILECDPDFIRRVINEKHGITLGYQSGASMNDSLVSQDANPLLVAADIIEHLLEKPSRSPWHSRINH